MPEQMREISQQPPGFVEGSQFAVLEGGGTATSPAVCTGEIPAGAPKMRRWSTNASAGCAGDKVTYQERLNALAQQADKFAHNSNGQNGPPLMPKAGG